MKTKLLKKMRKGLTIEREEINEGCKKTTPNSIYYRAYLNATRKDYEECSMAYLTMGEALRWVHSRMRSRIRDYSHKSFKIWP